MALNFPNSPSNGNTTTLNNVTYTYNSTKGVWETTNITNGAGITLSNLSVGAEPSASGDGAVAYNNTTGVFTYTPPVLSSGGTTTVYNTASLLPLSGNTSGDMAFAKDNNRFYVWNGAGWYSVALVNASPTISSGVASNVTLSTSGSATVVTITASDPEGNPLTYAYSVTSGSLTNGGGATATVVQGTGSNTHVFTVTPTTNESYGGTFTLTFTATDGVNTATSAGAFSLAFATPMTRGTQLLLKTSGNNNRTNQTFDDSSTSNHTLTVGGTAYNSSVSPFNDLWSTYFDGGDHLSFGHATDFEFSTNEWCMEGWVWCTGYISGLQYSLNALWGTPQGGDYSGVQINFGSNRIIMIYMGNTAGNGWGTTLNTGYALPVHEWVHLAFIRNNTDNKVYLYANGREEASVAISGGIGNPNDTFNVGGTTSPFTYSFGGYISDVRFVLGDKVYSGEFTPPSEKLTAISNTKVLTCQDNRFKDNSGGNAKTLTIVGDPKISAEAPYIIPDSWSSSDGGSVYLDGDSDYVHIPDSTDFDFGTASFSIETWVYPEATANNYPTFIGSVTGWSAGASSHRFDNTGASNYFTMHLNGSSGVSSGDPFMKSASTFSHNEWHHYVVTRDGNNFRMFINGVLEDVQTHSGSYDLSNGTGGVRVGYSTWDGGNGYYKGNVADVRITKGSIPTAYQTSSTTEGAAIFTPPTTSTALESNTKLKLNFADAGIFDKAGKNSIKLIGNSKESTTQQKYATTSLFLDGTGDYVNIPSVTPPQTDDFQLEGWFYETSSGDNGLFQAFAPLSNSTGGVAIGTVGGTMWYQQANSQTNIGSHWGQNSWKHLAVVRRNGTQHLFVDGTRIDFRANTTDLTDGQINIGGYYGTNNLTSGYFEDFRYLKGHTTYPNERPQEALTAPSGTVLQLANASSIPSSPNGLTLSVGAGSPTVSTFKPPYSTVSHSIRYDGNDRTDIASHANLTFGTGDFCIEMHLNIVSQGSTWASILDWRHSSQADAAAISLTHTSSNLYVYAGGTYHVTGMPVVLNKWRHIVYQRITISGTQYDEFYIDGVLLHQATDSTNWTASTLKIGSSAFNDHADFFISDLRINKGNAIYSSTFTPPSAAL